MDHIENRLEELTTIVDAHGKRDEEQFSLLRMSIDDLRGDISKIVDTLDEAISGNNARAGLRERVRRLEEKEQDRKWAFKIVWGAILVQAIVLAFRIITIKPQ